MAYIFLRPNLFMQRPLAFRETIIAQGRFFEAVGDAKITCRGCACHCVSRAALVEFRHEGRIYNLTSPQALSQIAEKLSRALGRCINFVNVPPETMREMLIKVRLPLWQADGLIEDYAHYSRGEAATATLLRRICE